MPSDPVGSPKTLHLLASGGALGGLVGWLVGLSASPVVASVTSALTGIAVAYATAKLGAGAGADTGEAGAAAAEGEAKKKRGGAARIVPDREGASHVLTFLTGFSVAAMCTVGVGIYTRTHDLLSPKPRDVVARWMDAGLTREQAQQVALNQLNGQVDITADPLFLRPKAIVEAWQDAGLSPLNAQALAVEQWHESAARTTSAASPPAQASDEGAHEKEKPKKKESEAPESSTARSVRRAPSTKDSVLIAGELRDCDDLEGKINTSQWPLVEDKFAALGGEWKRALEAAKKLPETDRHTKLEQFYRTQCTVPQGGTGK